LHCFLQKQVAIKLLHARFADPLALKNFHREAQFIASLDHPHIVRVLEFGLADTIPYLAMEYAQKKNPVLANPVDYRASLARWPGFCSLIGS
jgi:serine/threonine protein kinase